AEQGLAQRRALALDGFVGVDVQFVEHARDLGLNGRAARPPGDQAHLADRSMRAEAAHAHRPDVAEVNDDAEATLEDEMQRGRRVALSGDNLAGLNFETPAV